MEIYLEALDIVSINDLPSNRFNVTAIFSDQRIDATLEEGYSEMFDNSIFVKPSKNDIKITIKASLDGIPTDEIRGDFVIPQTVLQNSEEIFSKWVNLTKQGKAKVLKGSVKINLKAQINYNSTKVGPTKTINSDTKKKTKKNPTTEDIVREINAQNAKAYKNYPNNPLTKNSNKLANLNKAYHSENYQPAKTTTGRVIEEGVEHKNESTNEPEPENQLDSSTYSYKLDKIELEAEAKKINVSKELNTQLELSISDFKSLYNKSLIERYNIILNLVYLRK